MVPELLCGLRCCSLLVLRSFWMLPDQVFRLLLLAASLAGLEWLCAASWLLEVAPLMPWLRLSFDETLIGVVVGISQVLVEKVSRAAEAFLRRPSSQWQLQVLPGLRISLGSQVPKLEFVDSLR